MTETTADPRLKTTRVPLDSLKEWEGNARRGVVSAIKESMRVNGVFHPLDVQTSTRRIIAGNHRYKALQELHMEEPEDPRWGPDVDVIFHDVNDKRALKMHLADNKTADDATWDTDELIAQLQQAVEDDSLEGTGFAEDDLQDLLDGLDEDLGEEMDDRSGAQNTAPTNNGSLAVRFGVPPFTILDTRQGPWRNRATAWKSLGIQSEVGREGELAYHNPFNLYRNWMSVRNTIQEELGHKPTDEEVLAHPLAAQLTKINEGGGTSIFDPVLCELLYRWFSSPGDSVIDPWAGGSVRGIVAAALSRDYTGIDLRAEQVEANRDQLGILDQLSGVATSTPHVTDPEELTPVQTVGPYRVKRDDYFGVSDSRGGKVRTCLHIARQALQDGATTLVTAGSRQSPQVNIVAEVAAHLGLSAQCHVPQGENTPELTSALASGAELVRHQAGYNTVIVARAREAAKQDGHVEVPFGMEDPLAVTYTAAQVENIPVDTPRIVMPVGSGMSLAGVLHGLQERGLHIPVLGVCVGADPLERLSEYAPDGWEDMVTLVHSEQDYHDPAPETVLGKIQLDPIYEAKCLPYLEDGDLLWIVGKRATVGEDILDKGEPTWLHGESTEVLSTLEEGAYSMAIGCPPYYDLEKYSDDPQDLSTMTPEDFDAAMVRNIQALERTLAPDSFAAMVVASVRGKDGTILDMRRCMTDAFTAAGMHLVNDAVLINHVGNGGMRASRPFLGARTLTRVHQEVLVFVKGDRKAAAVRLGEVDVTDSLKALGDVADEAAEEEGVAVEELED